MTSKQNKLKIEKRKLLAIPLIACLCVSLCFGISFSKVFANLDGDFFMPFNLNFEAGSKFRIATGVRWVTDRDGTGSDRGRVLLIVPRSGLGFRYGIRLSNTVGVIDADYCDSENEGHIIISLENPSETTIELAEGKAFAQGIIVKYEIPEGAESEESRSGGFGSTDR